jgi:ABC-2 type transport system permease protein
MSLPLALTPIVLRPKAIALGNIIRDGLRSYQQIIRCAVLIGFALLFSWSIFYGTSLLILRLHEHVDIAYVPPTIPLGLFLLFILFMLFLSSAVSAIGSLFHSRDMDLLLASPLSKPRLYFGKVCEILLSSSWLVIVFGVPAILGFGSAYRAELSYYLMIPVVMLPYFVTPTAVAVILATIFASILPATRTRELFGIITVITFLGLFYLFRLILPSEASWTDINTMLRMIAVLLTPNAPWIPSYWASAILGEFLEPTGKSIAVYLILLYSAASASLGLTYCTLRICHFSGYSRARAQRLGSRAVSSGTPLLVALIPASRPYKAILTKEYRVFTRDITQALQLLLLLGLCVIYLYNLRILHAVQGLSPELRSWWEGFLSVTNICLGAFITSAMCTRFVFPSLSLEGQSFWILQTSPLSIRDILKAKLLAWYFPVALVASVVFSAGALAINAAPAVVLANIFMSWVIAYGIVGLAIGLGAHFANFDWDHPSQLAASFGSLVFMLLSVVTIFINMIPPLILVFLRSERLSAELSEGRWYLAVICAVVLLVYINYALVRGALSMGERSLLARQGR